MTYPLALDELKQTVSTLSAPDQSGLTIEQRLVLLGQVIGQLADVDKSDEADFNTLVDELQAVGNDLKDKIDAIDFADADTVATISENLTALKTLIEGDAGITILSTLDALADKINERTVSKTYVAVLSDTTGEFTIDISALGLADVGDYSVQLSQNVTSTFPLVNIGAKKVDKDSVLIKAMDNAYTPETATAFNASSTNVTVDVTISYIDPNPILITVTETDGDTTVVGLQTQSLTPPLTPPQPPVIKP